MQDKNKDQNINKELEVQLKKHFKCDKRRLKLIANLIIGLLKLRESCLSKWCKSLGGDRSEQARYKQLQRFARYFRFSSKLYAQVIWQMYGQEQEVYLTLDRSEWKMRGKWVQVIMVGIAYQGMSIPLLWQTLNGQGNTPKVVRRAILACFDKWIAPSKDQKIWWVADREFIGKEWFEAISSRGMDFCIRLRKSAMVSRSGKAIKVYKLFETAHLRLLSKARKVHGCMLYLAGQRLTNGDYFIVCSSTKTKRLAQIYAKRWQIESLFACFKSRGFNLEQCRVNHSKRIKTIIFLLAMAATWAIRVGKWLIEQGKNIPLKKFKDHTVQPWKSVFRWGLDYLQTIILNNLDFHKLIILCPV
jgi:hypothetical protein